MEAKYQKQVDDMFFYGYRCCMKKHGIAQDTPSFFRTTRMKLQAALPRVEEMLLESVLLAGMLDLVFVRVYPSRMCLRRKNL